MFIGTLDKRSRQVVLSGTSDIIMIIFIFVSFRPIDNWLELDRVILSLKFL